jgi:hypothetical protein
MAPKIKRIRENERRGSKLPINIILPVWNF